jgi:hypothetical protein
MTTRVLSEDGVSDAPISLADEVWLIAVQLDPDHAFDNPYDPDLATPRTRRDRHPHLPPRRMSHRDRIGLGQFAARRRNRWLLGDLALQLAPLGDTRAHTCALTDLAEAISRGEVHGEPVKPITVSSLRKYHLVAAAWPTAIVASL